MDKETTDQCTAGIGTLIFEFELLSYLSHDIRFARAAQRALKSLHKARSPLGLYGSGIDVVSNNWTYINAG